MGLDHHKSTPVRVKQLEASTKAHSRDKDKGKGTSTVNLPCRYFRSDTGCKAGENCKWPHAAGFVGPRIIASLIAS